MSELEQLQQELTRLKNENWRLVHTIEDMGAALKGELPPALRNCVEAAAVVVGQELLDRAEAAEAERDKLARFKDWVHAYLDGKGIPTHPDGPHSKCGCRIGDRMDLVFAEVERLRGMVDDLSVIEKTIKLFWSDSQPGSSVEKYLAAVAAYRESKGTAP